jgi:HD superfamily phosphohydrolase
MLAPFNVIKKIDKKYHFYSIIKMDILNLVRNLLGPELESKIFSEEGSKLILDNVTGSIRIFKDVLKLIHTPKFQRLHNIKQLGFCYLVFPTAKHSRFEHSVSVCYLAYILCMVIRKKYPDKEYNIKELGIVSKLTDQIILYIVIGGLFHDSGHSAFSHAFDDIVLKNSKHPNSIHEVRSIIIMEEVCKQELNFQQNEINFIASLINPSSHHTGVLYQIISNNLNGLDVDKFDYLRRDPINLGLKFQFDYSRILQEFIIDKNDNIAYNKHISWDILNCFTSRYNLFSIAYNHKTVKLIEEMFADILELIDSIFHISDCILDMKKFIRYTDEKIFNDLTNAYDEIKSNESKYTEPEKSKIITAYKLYQNILTRKLYKSVFYDNKVTKKQAEEFVDTLPYDKNTYKIITVKNGFVSDKKPDPFKSIYFYDDPNKPTFTLDKTYISGLLNGNYSEIKVLLICKDRGIAKFIKEKWETYRKEVLKLD